MRKTSVAALGGLAILITTLSCGPKKQTYRVPPLIDLAQHEIIGVIEFDSEARGQLAALATRRFTEGARADQGLVRMVQLGTESEALASVGKGQRGAEAYMALGRERGVRTLLLGELTVSSVRPDVQLAAGLRSGHLSAKVDATLAVQLVETATGASLWSTSARSTQSVGHISLFRGGEFVFDAKDPEQAYGNLVDHLVALTTRDFRATWERR